MLSLLKMLSVTKGYSGRTLSEEREVAALKGNTKVREVGHSSVSVFPQ